jgi:hypothetical protein
MGAEMLTAPMGTRPWAPRRSRRPWARGHGRRGPDGAHRHTPMGAMKLDAPMVTWSLGEAGDRRQVAMGAMNPEALMGRRPSGGDPESAHGQAAMGALKLEGTARP